MQTDKASIALHALMQLADRAELGAATQAVSVFTGSCCSDVAHAGLAIVAIDHDGGATAQMAADRIAGEAWHRRSEFVCDPDLLKLGAYRKLRRPIYPLDDAIDVAEPWASAGRVGQ